MCAACFRISFCVSPAADEPNELAVDGVDNATPVDTAIVHQAIERVLLAGEEFAQGTVGVVRRCLHGEERQLGFLTGPPFWPV